MRRFAVLLAVLAVAGCGGDEPEPQPQVQAPGPTATAPVAPEQTATPAALDGEDSIRTEFQAASANGNFDTTSLTFTAEGKQHLREAARLWEQYLKKTPKPDPDLATIMVQVYGQGALGQAQDALAAQQIVADAHPQDASVLVQLATYAYAAGATAKGDRAAKRAIALAKPAQRKALEQQLDQIAKTGKVPEVGP